MADARLEILFVDDERRILDGLRRQLHARRDRWGMRFAESGVAALAMLADRPADVVVTDMRMPGMTGSELLRHVLDRWPHTVRIILSGQTDQADLICNLAPIHQYLQKPCPAETLSAAVERTHRLALRLGDPRVRLAAGRSAVLVPGPAVYAAFKAELAGTNAQPRVVADLAERDPAIAGKLVQLVSGAFFGSPRAVHGVREAVDALGVAVIQSVVVAGHLFDTLAGADGVGPIWAASAAVADAAHRFAVRAGAPPAVQQQARLAGLMSLVGRAVLLTADPGAYAQVLARAAAGDPLGDAEQAVFGTRQADVAAYTLGLWAFPEAVVEAVACQDRPAELTATAGHHPGAFLHLARALPAQPLDADFVLSRGLGSLLADAPPDPLRRSA